jgi:K+-transporting ATPase A subunit
MKMRGTAAGFYGMNSAHPLDNPNVVTNRFTTFCMMLFPMA